MLTEYYEDIPIIRVETDSLDLVHNASDKILATRDAVNEAIARIAA